MARLCQAATQMLTTRVLPPDEWPALVGTEADTVWSRLSPDNAQVFVVEEDGQIAGCWIAMRIVHAECLWIAPSHRGSFAVMRRLWGGMRQMVRAWGAPVFFTSAITNDVRDLLMRFQARRVPGDTYVLDAVAGKDSLCQQP